MKEINTAILKAVTKVRRELAKTMSKRTKRGRPTEAEDKCTVKKNKRIQAKITALLDNRFLFVQKELTKKMRETLKRITRGFPELRKLREIVEEVYRLFDRRCSIDTALEKLQKHRERVKRFKELSKSMTKLESPTLEKSFDFCAMSYCRRRRTRWNEESATTERCRRRCIVFVRKFMLKIGLLWTCIVNCVFPLVAGRSSGYTENVATNSNAPADGKQGQVK